MHQRSNTPAAYSGGVEQALLQGTIYEKCQALSLALADEAHLKVCTASLECSAVFLLIVLQQKTLLISGAKKLLSSDGTEGIWIPTLSTWLAD